MLAATTFSLLLPALEESKHTFLLSPFATVTIVSIFMLSGIAFIKVVSRYLNFEQYIQTQAHIDAEFARKVWISFLRSLYITFPRGWQ